MKTIPIKKNHLYFVLAGFIVLMGLITAHRAHSGSNDYDTFYEAGRAVLTGEGIYYKGEYHEQGSKTGPFLYPPFAAIFFALFAWMPLSISAFTWSLGLVSAFAACFLWSLGQVNVRLHQVKELWTQAHLIDKLIFPLFAFVLLLDNLTMAQFNLAVLAVCMAGLTLWRFDSKFTAGIVIAFAALMKVTPALFLIYFLMKRQWRVLGGAFIGLLIGSIILPTIIFGIDNNRIYHRQFFGRTVKPMLISLQARFSEAEAEHPLKKSADEIEHVRLTSQLTKKNQSLSATMSRLLLKNRNDLAFSDAAPIHAAKKYKNLPVLFGGIPQKYLGTVIRAVQFLLLITLAWTWSRRRKNPHPLKIPIEIATVFLSMTLLSPLARSHQFIIWLLPLTIVFCFNRGALLKKGCSYMLDRPNIAFLTYGVRAAFVFYILQAIPYGKAAGMGCWANLVLWISYINVLLHMATNNPSLSEPKTL